MKEAVATSVTSSGNVFEDLGFERGEAANMLMRADLMIEIERYIREERMSQRRAA
jgi:predicted XRE-type DNA-binding protein